jgi:hypothetical protein
MYPIGLLCGVACLLWKAKTSIAAGAHTPLSKSIKFLYNEYNLVTYWWEVMEILRKFVLTGLFAILDPGSVLQVSVATVFSAAYLMVQLQACPFKEPFDDYLAKAASFSIVIVALNR